MLSLPTFLDSQGNVNDSVIVRTEPEMEQIYGRKAMLIAQYARENRDRHGKRTLLVSTLQASTYSFDRIFYYLGDSAYSDIQGWIVRTHIWPAGGGKLGKAKLRLRRDCPIPFAGECVMIYDFLCHFGNTSTFLLERKHIQMPIHKRAFRLEFMYGIRNGKDANLKPGTPLSWGGMTELETLDTDLYLYWCGLDYAKTKRGKSLLREGSVLAAAPKGCSFIRINGITHALAA